MQLFGSTTCCDWETVALVMLDELVEDSNELRDGYADIENWDLVIIGTFLAEVHLSESCVGLGTSDIVRADIGNWNSS